MFLQMRYIITSLLLVFICVSCNSTAIITQDKSSTISYLALGDSYTIGESVAENQRWPVQLVQKLKEEGYPIQSPKIIAKTGWRTDELLEAMNNEQGEEKYDLVSVLIGVNNQYQARDFKQLQEELEIILQQAIKKSKQGADGVFVLSIPDYSVTPFAKGRKVDEIAREIKSYNEQCKLMSNNYGIKYFYITDISKKASENLDLVATDGLHPSAEMYTQWVEKIYTNVKQMLNE